MNLGAFNQEDGRLLERFDSLSAKDMAHFLHAWEIVVKLPIQEEEAPLLPPLHWVMQTDHFLERDLWDQTRMNALGVPAPSPHQDTGDIFLPY